MIKSAQAKTDALVVKLAETEEEIEKAFRLRYQIFVEEARNFHLMNQIGKEQDLYDEYCDHLIVLHAESEEVVGTYRLLPGERVMNSHGFYSETEFDLSAFHPYKSITLEVGRSCIAPEYRNGKAIQMLWGGIADYIRQSGHQYLIGCVSLYLEDLKEINELYSMLKNKGIITEHFGIRPLDTHRIKGLTLLTEGQFDEKEVHRKLPPLLKGYQWLGAQLAGEPVLDPIFQTVDFFVILETDNITSRYRRRFL